MTLEASPLLSGWPAPCSGRERIEVCEAVLKVQVLVGSETFVRDTKRGKIDGTSLGTRVFSWYEAVFTGENLAKYWQNRRLGRMLLLLGVVGFVGCLIKGGNPVLDTQDVRLTILHTSDLHSRLIRYRFSPGYVDKKLGLDETLAEQYGVGGADRLAYLIARERALGQRVVHVDSGDSFQGAPIYNLWKGSAEIQVMSQLGMDASVVGNHEFDAGAQVFADHVEALARFPLIASNYIFEDDRSLWANSLGRVVQPWTIVNAKGLRVALVGMGNLSSLNSLPEQGNSLGIIPLDTIYAAQTAVDQVRSFADVVVLVSHMGLDEDEKMAREVRGVDVIMGGHLHIALNPPKVLKDPDGRDVIIAHSGAFMKYLGRLDLVLRKPTDATLAKTHGFEVVSHRYELFPIDQRIDNEIAKTDKAPHEIEATKAYVEMREILEPYEIALNQTLDLDRTIGCATSDRLKRFGSNNGDSPLGNIVAEALQTHERVQTDFAITNSTGVRDDLRGEVLDESHPGVCFDENGNPVYSFNLEELYNVLPFDNTITTMFLSGLEVQELFDYVSSRSATRGCNSQAQVSGMTFTLVCTGDEEHGDYPHADDIKIGGLPLNVNGTYELATNNYIANGGSGYEVLQRNTTQIDTFIPMREAVVEYFGRANLVPCSDTDPIYPKCPGNMVSAGLEDDRIVVRF